LVWVLVAVVVALVAAGVAAWRYREKRRTEALADRFGPEYGRAIGEYGDRSRAEAELEARVQRVEAFDIRPLSSEQQSRFAREWRSVQARFVDDPGGAVADADALVQQAMAERGYPIEDFERRAADLSVDHPHVVDNYRVAHDIARRSREGEASTEQLRKAMVYYRSLFEELLEAHAGQTAEVTR